MPLRDASFQRVRAIPDDRGAEWACAQFWQAPVPFNPKGTASSVAPLPAYVNEGRWVVDCPDCHGAQLACVSDPRFMCVLCANLAVGHQWRLVKWPANRAAIDALLANRQPVNQNWLPGETLKALRAENDMFGVPA